MKGDVHGAKSTENHETWELTNGQVVHLFLGLLDQLHGQNVVSPIFVQIFGGIELQRACKHVKQCLGCFANRPIVGQLEVQEIPDHAGKLSA